MRIHLIAIGGSAMHNLALELDVNGHRVSGSDDEIYEPSRSRLKKAGLFPDQLGWNPAVISKDIDVVILGMHAKKDNPEMLRAQELGLNILSYPEFIYNQSKDKKRVVIAGSHGKTTTTSIILHVLKSLNYEFDYLVGAQIQGFERMVSLSSAPVIIIEGDEYLSSAMDSRSKFQHYKADLSVITGVSWDHINVFKNEADYIDRFKTYIDKHEEGKVFYCEHDEVLISLVKEADSKAELVGYRRFEVDENLHLKHENATYDFPLIGNHNLENTAAAFWICQELGVSSTDFFTVLSAFKGANKRLQKIYETKDAIGFLDFAHAPSKVKATSNAVKTWYGNDKRLMVVLELHTYSSLNPTFLPQYSKTLEAADEVVVFYDAHTLSMKGMAPLSKKVVREAFNHNKLIVHDDKRIFHQWLDEVERRNAILLIMTSGNLRGYDLNKLNKWTDS